MNGGEIIAEVGDIEVAEEDLLRVQLYGLLASLLSKAPDQHTLTSLAQLSGDETALGKAIAALSRVSAGSNSAAVAEEYHDLFIGVGRGELLPYASYYLTGFLHEKPLAKLRNDMAAHGASKSEDVSEPEDHAASVLEVMAGLIDGRFGNPASIEDQEEFYEAHIASWMTVFFQDLGGASSSVLYATVAEVGLRFLEIESAAFKMD
ncbi:MAG: molecular chaperone TorD [Hyphomicrobiaceae bacterium TMED74]|nr:molecular chaperone TorD [Filomicrobium sp.]RPG35186.1 MAG: molecular chaperone TorD [Hyphomicrobiaceae bacterium TMED74]